MHLTLNMRSEFCEVNGRLLKRFRELEIIQTV